MLQLIFQDESAIERIRHLEDNASEVLPNYNYERILTQEEIAEQREAFSTDHIELGKIERAKSEALAQFNASLKNVKLKAADRLTKIRTGREEVTETVYVIQDFEEGKVGIYNQNGELISEKPMRGADRQLRIQTVKDGTNG